MTRGDSHWNCPEVFVFEEERFNPSEGSETPSIRFEARGDRSEGRVQVAPVALKLACFMESSERQRVESFHLYLA